MKGKTKGKARVYNKAERRERYLKHRQRDMDKAKEWKKMNLERLTEMNHKYYEANKEKIIRNTLRNRKLREAKSQSVSS